jgi:hypothetical protein
MRSNLTGQFVAWNYLHAFDTKENRAFIADWHGFTGQPKAVTGAGQKSSAGAVSPEFLVDPAQQPAALDRPLSPRQEPWNASKNSFGLFQIGPCWPGKTDP